VSSPDPAPVARASWLSFVVLGAIVAAVTWAATHMPAAPAPGTSTTPASAGSSATALDHAIDDVTRVLEGRADPAIALPRVREAAKQVLAARSDDARAEALLGRVAMLLDWNWNAAEAHLTRATALAPADGRIMQWFAEFYAAKGMQPEARDTAAAAAAQSPDDAGAHTTLGFAHYLARDFDEAEASLVRAVALAPRDVRAHRLLGLTFALTERPAEALAEFERAQAIAGDTPQALADLAMARALAGDDAGARRLATRLAAAVQQAAWRAPDGIAQVYWALHDRDTAVQWLQKAYAARVPAMAFVLVDPLWVGVNDDRRVKALAAGVSAGRVEGAPEY